MEKPKVGDKVHIGHGSKDGAGVKGIVTKIEGDTVHIRSLKAEISDLTKKPTYKQYKGDIRNVTVESEQIDEIDLDWQYKNIMQTKGLSDKAKKQTTDIYNKLKKKEQTIPQKKVTEDADRVDEISKDKLRDYKHKAELSEPKDDHGYTNRSKGIERADKKLNKGYASDANAKRGWSNESVEMEQIEEQKHRVAVTVSEPDHPAMSMRKATKQRFIHVSADSAKNAVERAKSYYKKSGYKVHGAEYVSLINEDSTQVEQMKKPYEQFIKSISEAWPGTPEYEAKFGKPKGLSGTTQGNRHDITVSGNVTRAVRRIDPVTGDTTEPKQKVDIQDGPKRGRGRPPGKYGAYAKKLKESLEIIESLETDEELDSYIDSLDEELVDELLAYIEEAEQIDELSIDTLQNYRKKALVAQNKRINTGEGKSRHHGLAASDGKIRRALRARERAIQGYNSKLQPLGVAEETSTLASHVSRIVDECLKARKGVSEASRGIGNDALGDYEKDEVRQLLKDKAKVQKEADQTGSWRKETPWRKITEPDTTVDKSGAKHTMHSKVRDLARRAMNKNPNVPQKVKESLDVLITMDEQFDLDGYFYELDEDIGSSVLEALEQPLDEGKIITQDSNKSLWPGRKNNYDIIKKYPAASGNTAYVVMQKNGFHGVLVLDKNNNLIRSYINAHNLEKAHAVARHYAAKGDIGMNQVIPGGWTLGGGLESVIDVNESDIHVKEEQLEESISQYASFLTR